MSKLPLDRAVGIEQSVNTLAHARPGRNITGFAPAGKVMTHQWGANQSPFFGSGMEYAESRVYQAGDDIRNIDWRVTARTGNTYTKLYQEERERPVLILADLRSMMQFGTRSRFKSHMAAEVAAMLAWVGFDGGDRVGGLILSRDGVVDAKASRTQRSLRKFFALLAEQTSLGAEAGEEVALAKGLQRMRRITRPGTLLFIVSDFSDYDAATERELINLSRHAHLTLIQISDPLDQHLPSRAGKISDGESVIALNQISQRALEAYAGIYQARHEAIDSLARRHGMVLHRLQTTDDVTQILLPDNLAKLPRQRRAA